MRIGLREMRAFSKLLFPSVRDNTFFESCGVADLITTCRTYLHHCQLTIQQMNTEKRVLHDSWWEEQKSG
jgi:glycerol-3-phosphate dehydrogenase